MISDLLDLGQGSRIRAQSLVWGVFRVAFEVQIDAHTAFNSIACYVKKHISFEKQERTQSLTLGGTSLRTVRLKVAKPKIPVSATTGIQVLESLNISSRGGGRIGCVGIDRVGKKRSSIVSGIVSDRSIAGRFRSAS